MTDNGTSGQNVPNMAEGLYLMDGIKGLLSLPQHSVDMPVSYTHLPREMKDTILALLDEWKEKQPPELGKPEKKKDMEK